MPKPIAGQARAQRVAPAFLLGRLFIYGNSEDSAGAISRVMGPMRISTRRVALLRRPVWR
jgi:hypothetical protein